MLALLRGLLARVSGASRSGRTTARARLLVRFGEPDLAQLIRGPTRCSSSVVGTHIVTLGSTDALSDSRLQRGHLAISLGARISQVLARLRDDADRVEPLILKASSAFDCFFR